MMMNLFSVFDPSTSMNFSMNWISSMFIILIFPLSYWFIPSRYMMFFMVILDNLSNEFKMLLSKKVNYMNMLIFMTLFLNIFLNNFMGLFPYIFTSSSHLVMSLSLSLMLWMSFMLFGWIKNMNHMFTHLLPQGTPLVLMPFMVMIETISNIIRPGSLAVRLSANMIAGHLLLTLMSSGGSTLSSIMLMLMLLFQSGLLMFEMGVSIIQAYVFSVLSTLYSSETN